MTADVIYLHRPLPSSTEERVKKIEKLAYETVTPLAKLFALQPIAHPSLGGRLWRAWMAAEEAIQVRDRTDPDDMDYEGYAEKAENAISVLLYGNINGGSAA
jgi:hypothetical protein